MSQPPRLLVRFEYEKAASIYLGAQGHLKWVGFDLTRSGKAGAFSYSIYIPLREIGFTRETSSPPLT